jgi:DNA primase
MKEAALAVDGMRLVVTHLDKVLWPRTKGGEEHTRRNYLRYLLMMAPHLLRHLCATDRSRSIRQPERGVKTLSAPYSMRGIPVLRLRCPSTGPISPGVNPLDYPLATVPRTLGKRGRRLGASSGRKDQDIAVVLRHGV